MASRLDGFYYARYEGLNEGGGAGQGVVTLLGGKVYGGDSATCFVGFCDVRDNIVVARVAVHPLGGAYQSVVGFEERPYDLTEIRAREPLPVGELPDDFEANLDAERYDKHLAISLYLKRLIKF
jgi:hypothetical protein